jgi:hypothetical protein
LSSSCRSFRGLFRAIDEGNAGLNIPAYNGGLFALDAALDALQVPDEVCAHFKELGDYDYRPARGKQLTSLDHTIREGNSVISDPAVHPKAFDWQAAFPEVFAQGGFDAIVGNPPYIRQELLSPFKPWLEAHYEVFHGMADLYVYFYELGVRMLKPGGLLRRRFLFPTRYPLRTGKGLRLLAQNRRKNRQDLSVDVPHRIGHLHAMFGESQKTKSPSSLQGRVHAGGQGAISYQPLTPSLGRS